MRRVEFGGFFFVSGSGEILTFGGEEFGEMGANITLQGG